jgi:hypothetical protein
LKQVQQQLEEEKQNTSTTLQEESQVDDNIISRNDENQLLLLQESRQNEQDSDSSEDDVESDSQHFSEDVGDFETNLVSNNDNNKRTTNKGFQNTTDLKIHFVNDGFCEFVLII